MAPERCNNSYMTKRGGKALPMTHLLRRAIAESGISFKALSEATGLTRPSLMRFARGQQSLRLDLAEKLAAYFGIECRPPRRRGGKGQEHGKHRS